MQVTITLSDHDKKALRYLGVEQDDVNAEVVVLGNQLVHEYVVQAKKNWLSTKDMDDVDPTSIQKII